MPEKKITKFQKERERLNRIVMKYGSTNIKRFYSIDSQVYKAGALPAKTKELLGSITADFKEISTLSRTLNSEKCFLKMSVLGLTHKVLREQIYEVKH